MSKTKHREFWIAKQNQMYSDEKITDSIHVIEKAALDEACEVIRELAGVFEEIYKMHEYDCEEELYGCRCVTVSLAKPALEKIKQWRGEPTSQRVAKGEK